MLIDPFVKTQIGNDKHELFIAVTPKTSNKYSLLFTNIMEGHPKNQLFKLAFSRVLFLGDGRF